MSEAAEIAAVSIARNIRRNHIRNDRRTMVVVIRTVELVFGLRQGNILGRKRPAQIVRPRHIAWWLARELTDYSLPRLGKEFCRDHSTIFSGLKSLENHRRINPELDAICVDLISSLEYLKESGPSQERECTE